MSEKINEFLKSGNSKNFLFGILIGLGVLTLFLLLFSGVFLIFGISRAYSKVFATIAVAIGAMISAYYSSRKIGKKGYLTGFLNGLVFFTVVTFIALIINKGGLTSNTLFRFIIVFLSSLIGGIAGVNKKQKKYI